LEELIADENIDPDIKEKASYLKDNAGEFLRRANPLKNQRKDYKS
jgi:hypothetical protein